MARAGITLTINALSALIFVVTLGLVLGYYFFNQRAGQTPGTGGAKL
jgi:spermidine/putrescine transport system permease protein